MVGIDGRGGFYRCQLARLCAHALNWGQIVQFDHSHHHQHRNQYRDDHHNDHKQSSSPSISLSLCAHAPNQWRSVQSDHSHQQHHNQHQYDQSNHLLILMFTCRRICTTAKV